MSQDRVFTLVGDSNIRRFNTEVNQRACPELSRAQVISCMKLALLPDCLSEVRSESNICVVSCISNFICDAPSGSASVTVRVESVIQDFRQHLYRAGAGSPERKYLVCPPMYRRSPLWYRDGISEIMSKFSSMFSASSGPPPNVHILPSFSRPEFDPDGVHLTPYAGLEFIFHIFDSSRDVLSSLVKDHGSRISEGLEAIRTLQDRMMANEQDHKRLNLSFEAKLAVDAELADFQENVRNEVYFVVSGLPRIPGDLRGQEWQNRALSDVKRLIQTLLNKDLPVVVVQNITGRGTDAVTRYHVRMEFAAHSQEIRTKFGSYFIGGNDRRPQGLKDISISNRITPGTQTRIAILRLMAKRYEASNPSGKAKVIGFESRPIIRLTPPTGSDKRVRTFTFIEAVKSLPTCFTSDEVRPILAKVDPKFKGKLRATFIVLSDDDYQPKLRSKRPREADATEIEPGSTRVRT